MHIIPNLVYKSQLIAACSIILLLGLLAYIFTRQASTFPPNTYIDSLDVSGMTPVQARETVALAVRDYRGRWPIQLTYETIEIPLSLDAAAVSYHIGETIDSLQQTNLQLYHLPVINRPTHAPLVVDVHPGWLASVSATIAQTVSKPALSAHVEVVQTASGAAVKIIDGQDGQQLDQPAWEQQLTTALKTLTIPPTKLQTTPVIQSVTGEQKREAYHRATSLLAQTLNLQLLIENQTEKTWQLSGQDLVRFVSIQTKYDIPVIKSYIDGLAQNINQPPKDAKFQFDESVGKVKDFIPAEKGITVDIDKTSDAIVSALDNLMIDPQADTALIITHTTQPAVQLSEVNRLGIRERIGVGRSTFQHSIASRVHNVILGASRINGTLIKPGEEFSFNQAVGDISAATGYQQAYIIQNGRTVLGDGGGMCQVSTTVFRTALNAGLPITARRGHAYRVGYYEQDSKAGIDATVFSPSTDFKFLNDTSAHILVQTQVDEPNRELTIYFYGTSDGRTATIKDHEVWGITPPLPDVWVDDPTMQNGTVKQVDWKAAGAKAKFTQVVERNGQLLFEKTFYTNYQPWASVFLRGTKQ